MTFDRRIPYNDLPLLPPAGIELETRAVLKKAISARTALAELKVAGHLIPNQAVLIQALGLQEAKLSSEIENIVTTNDELYRGFSQGDGSGNPATKEVLRYKDALWMGYNALRNENRPLGTRLFEEIFAAIKQSQDGIRRIPGTKLSNPLTGDVIYTPPEGDVLIRNKLANLEAFIHQPDDLDPLVKMAILHYQFEAIHPFTDGNGRTGRILNLLYLIDQGLLDIPVLYLSRYIIEHKNDYYEGLRSVTERQTWEAWILYMLQAVESTARLTCGKIRGIEQLMHETAEIILSSLPKIYSWDLVEAIFQQPYCRIHFLEDAQIAKFETASRYLKKLSDIRVLRPLKAGRDIYYVNTKFLDLLIQ